MRSRGYYFGPEVTKWEPMGSYGFKISRYFTTCGPGRCLGPWGQCSGPGDMMMVTNHLTKTTQELSQYHDAMNIDLIMFWIYIDYVVLTMTNI